MCCLGMMRPAAMGESGSGRFEDGLVCPSQETWNPALPPPLIIEVSAPEHLLKARFVLEHPAVEPKRACGEQKERKPRDERDRQAQHENQVAEIHRVADITIRPVLHDAIWRNAKSRTAAAHSIAKTPDQHILQISPGEQHKSRGFDGERSALPRELECDHKQRAQNESLHRRPLEPAKQSRASHGCLDLDGCEPVFVQVCAGSDQAGACIGILAILRYSAMLVLCVVARATRFS